MEQEADFEISELFFSKTDFRGIIQSGNEVFVRISEYQQEELYRKPHNIIRHSDMPSAVFKLFWSFIQGSRPIAAYVKNKSKSDRFYWVFAMVFPMEDGYLSVRLKPTSSLFPIVKGIYAEILERQQQGQSLEEGIALLLERLKSLGYQTYEQFMSAALLQELKSRDLLLQQISDEAARHVLKTEDSFVELLGAANGCVSAARSAFQRTGQLHETTQNLLETTQTLLEVCRRVKLITTNLTVTSLKLGEVGKPLSVVSGNLEKLCQDILASSTRFEEVFAVFKESAGAMYFAMGASRFQIEMMNQLILESQAAQASSEALVSNCRLLKKLIADNFQQAEQISLKLIANSQNLLQSLTVLSRVISGMDVICIVGKIEMARIRELTTSLESHLLDIEKMNRNFKDSLKVMDSDCKNGLDYTMTLRQLMGRISSSLSKIEMILSV